MSKMDAMRHTLSELGRNAKPAEIKEHLKSRFNIDMAPGMISNYKSTVNAEGKSGLIRRPRGTSPALKAGTPDFSLEDLQAVKAVADRIGADKVRQLAQVLAK